MGESGGRGQGDRLQEMGESRGRGQDDRKQVRIKHCHIRLQS